MKAALIAVIVAIAPGSLFAAPPMGVFRTEANEDGRYLLVTMAPCGGDALQACGVIEGAYEPDGSRIDAFEDAGKPIVWDMRESSPGKFEGGKIWRPTDDRTFNSRMTDNGDTLAVSGCVAVFCSSQTWIRVN